MTHYPPRGGSRVGYKPVAHSMFTAEPPQPSTSSSRCGTSPVPVMVSSDESDSESSFADSNDSDDEGENGDPEASMELAKSTHPSRIGVKQVTPQKNTAQSDVMATSSNDKDSGETEDLLPGWTGAEVTYFRLLHPVFGHNYCAIAELLRTKKCQEVYEYSQQVSGTLLLDQPERMRRLAGKKKKRNMRWSILGLSAPPLFLCSKFRMERRGRGTLSLGRVPLDIKSSELGSGTPNQSLMIVEPVPALLLSSDRTWSHHHRKIQSKLEGQATYRYNYKPCLHPGKACDGSSSCRCALSTNFCEKYCNCSPDCQNRFPGCRCRTGSCNTKHCPCFLAVRECDPDLCNLCGAGGCIPHTNVFPFCATLTYTATCRFQVACPRSIPRSDR